MSNADDNPARRPQPPRPAEAERQYREAAVLGDAEAMTLLGIVLEEDGRVDEAEQWYRRGAATGRYQCMVQLGHFLHGSGRIAEAEGWYGASADIPESKARVANATAGLRSSPQPPRHPFFAIASSDHPRLIAAYGDVFYEVMDEVLTEMEGGSEVASKLDADSFEERCKRALADGGASG